MATEDQEQSIFESINHALKLQIDLAAPDGGWQSTEKLTTSESIGYIFGFVDGVQQAFKVNDMDTKMEMLAAVMITLLGEQAGTASARKALEMQTDQDFDLARKVAGQQAVAFIRDKKPPMGLSHILFGHPLDTVYGLNSDTGENTSSSNNKDSSNNTKGCLGMLLLFLVLAGFSAKFIQLLIV